jgi:predicted acyl esterase
MSRREVRIPMDDGVELAATLYLPTESAGPQPCLLEALPYRKDDLTSGYADEYVRLRDEYGYAVCRLDLRGTGSSGGDATDEYPPREQVDLRAVIAWLADQPWCDGSVGMWGTSYSGFNSLQVACERPPALKAIVAIYATDDRWTDDVHWRGGQLRFIDQIDYCHYMTPMNALPPVPSVWGPDWRDEWQRRVETYEPWLLTWLAERTDGPYWRHGSVAPDYDRIECAVMIVAGWADGYRNNTFRTVEALRRGGIPHRLLAGPWAHVSAEAALPGPRIDLVSEMAAWWDRWLRGRDVAVDDGLSTPAVTAFVRSSTRPAPDLDTHEGHWVREEWPSPRVEPRTLPLDGRAPYVVRGDTGVDAWIDCAGHLPWGQSGDQRFDDAASMTWEWVADGLSILGQPQVRLRISADRPAAYVSAKLCDVFGDGTSALVSRGSLDLAFRTSSTSPTPLESGQPYDVTVPLDACAYSFDPGQRLRLSIAGADWPNTVAPSEPVTLTVHSGELVLPTWSGASPYDAPDLRAGGDAADDGEGVLWRVERDVLRRETACVVDHGSTYEVPHHGEATEHYRGRVAVDTQTFRQRADGDIRFRLAWPEATVETRSRLDLRVEAGEYDVTLELEAVEAPDTDGERIIARRRWHQTLPR